MNKSGDLRLRTGAIAAALNVGRQIVTNELARQSVLDDIRRHDLVTPARKRSHHRLTMQEAVLVGLFRYLRGSGLRGRAAAEIARSWESVVAEQIATSEDCKRPLVYVWPDDGCGAMTLTLSPSVLSNILRKIRPLYAAAQH